VTTTCGDFTSLYNKTWAFAPKLTLGDPIPTYPNNTNLGSGEGTNKGKKENSNNYED